MDAQKLVENILVETTFRSIYHGYQIHKDLAVLQDVINPSNQPALDFVRAWMLTLDLNEIYRKSLVQDNMLDLHELITCLLGIENSDIDTGEVLSA